MGDVRIHDVVRRRSGLVGLVAVAGVLLVGCDPAVAPPDWTIRLSGDVLEVVICEPAAGDVFTAYVEQATGERWREIWEITGDLSFPAGAILVPGSLGAGVDERYDGAGLTEQSTIRMFLRDGDRQAARVPIVLQASTPEGYWIDPDGQTFAQPCSTPVSPSAD